MGEQLAADIEGRTLTIVGEIEPDMMAWFLPALQAMEEDSTDEEVFVRLHSSGGCLLTAFGMYDAIRESPCTVNVDAYGDVTSAAVFVLLAATGYRSLGVNTRVLVHGPSKDLGATFQAFELEGRAHDMRRAMEVQARILHEAAPGILWDEVLAGGRDHGWWGQEAVDVGLATEVRLHLATEPQQPGAVVPLRGRKLHTGPYVSAGTPEDPAPDGG